MMRITLLLVIVMALLAACGSSNGIEEVTTIPEGQSQVTPTLTPPVVSVNAADDPAEEVDSVAPATVTPLPLDNNLEAGEARRMAEATDTAYQPTPRNEVAFNESPVSLTFGEFYDGFNMRAGLILSDKLVSLDGQQVTMEGFVAPPLKPEIDFFVLTSIPLSSCPFCSTAADWPDDIALIYLPDAEIVYSAYPVRVTGRLEVGTSVDAETGMVSLVRLYADDLEILE